LVQKLCQNPYIIWVIHGVVVGGGIRNVLVVGADALSKFVDWTDRGTCILFGDAAGAVLVQVQLTSCVNIAIIPLSQ